MFFYYTNNIKHASVTQLDRVSGFEPGSWGFESLRECHIHTKKVSFKRSKDVYK